MSGQKIREAYLEAGEFFAGVVDKVDIDGWDGPALGEWCVRDLTGHTYRSFTTVLSYSAKPGDKVELERPVDYFLKSFEALADPKQVAERGRAAGLEIIDDPKMMVRGFAMYVKNKLICSKDSPPAAGFKEVLYPGEIEWRTEQTRRKDGVFVEDETWEQISGLMASLNVEQAVGKQ